MAVDLKHNPESSNHSLREQISVAIMGQPQHLRCEPAVTGVRSNDLSRLKAETDFLELLLDCRSRFTEYLSRVKIPKACHSNAMVYLEDQIQGAEDHLYDMEMELLEDAGPEPSFAEVAVIMQMYLRPLVDLNATHFPTTGPSSMGSLDTITEQFECCSTSQRPPTSAGPNGLMRALSSVTRFLWRP